MVNLTRKENSTNTKKRGILRLLSAPARYIKCKVKSVYRKLVKKQPKKTDNELYNEENLKRKSIDELKEIAKLRGIENRGKLKKERLITSLLKSESSNTECNYIKHFNTNVSNNTNGNNNVNNNTNRDDDDTYDDKISDIRAILNRLGNIVTKNDRVKIKNELYGIENKKNLSAEEKEKINDSLAELVNKLNKKEKYHDSSALDYHGIRDIEYVFDNIDDDYYKPILVKGSFNENYKYHESRGDKNKKLSIEQYLDKIKPYLSDLINENKALENNLNEWKVQINMSVNFVSFNDTGEIRIIFVLSDNEEIRLGNETDDIVNRLVSSFLNNYQKEEIILRNGSNFVFESVDLLSYHIHKTSLKRGKSYIKSPEWVINKRATINPKNKDNKCFQYSITVALNHQNIENHPERISNIKPFIDQYNWEGIDFPAGIKDWKKFERNNKTIALNILLIPHNEILHTNQNIIVNVKIK